MRWRIKFVVLAMAVIFGAHLYVRSQAVLFGRPDPSLGGLESGALVIGCLLLVLAYARAGFSGVDLYPSRVALHSSVTLLLVGGYLFVVGVLAQLVGYLESADTFQLQTLVVLVGMAVLAVLLFSDRLRHGLRALVGRHFGKAQHDSARIWRLFSQRLANVNDQAGLGAASVRMTSEVFDALSVSIWILNESGDRFALTASTDRVATDAAQSPGRGATSSAVVAGLSDVLAPFDLERGTEPWAEELRQLNPASFTNGGSRWCVPVRQGETCLGVIVLADHVGGTPYTTEELDLLACCATQIASVLVNLRLGAEVVRAKELEAFRTMSAFFVHDLKNATSSLNLTLKNMPLHFDDPAFREDALRAIGNTTRRIEGMLERLSAFRAQRTTAVDADLAQIVREALDLEELADVELTRDLQPTPPILADREQIRSVVTNLVLNARDALGSSGRIDVRTAQRGNWAMLSVVDNGCGMSPEFVRDSLFRPFQSTKQHGLGIGLFQLRTIVLAHGGSVHVDSEPGHGTTFRVTLPLKAQT
jgi:putative PEP-CTERM system histidine kinase